MKGRGRGAVKECLFQYSFPIIASGRHNYLPLKFKTDIGPAGNNNYNPLNTYLECEGMGLVSMKFFCCTLIKFCTRVVPMRLGKHAINFVGGGGRGKELERDQRATTMSRRQADASWFSSCG